jgi:hypothetical protein
VIRYDRDDFAKAFPIILLIKSISDWSSLHSSVGPISIDKMFCSHWVISSIRFEVNGGILSQRGRTAAKTSY